MTKQIEKRYMKFKDFIEKYAWNGEGRYRFQLSNYDDSKLYIFVGGEMHLFYDIIDRYNNERIIQTHQTTDGIQKLIKKMNKEDFEHLKKVYDLCFVKYKE